MINYIRLIRPINALIVVFTLLVVRITIARQLAILEQYDMVNIFDYIGLMFIGVLILSGGNIINDIKDYHVDFINKPSKVIIPDLISVKNAWVLYFSVNALAIILSVMLVARYDVWSYLIIPIFGIIILYIYSVRLQHMYFIGNMVIAMCCAVLPGIGYLVEWENITLLKALPTSHWLLIIKGISITYYAWILMLCRELIKDCQDVNGDSYIASDTIPIRDGLSKSNVLIIVYFILFIVGFIFFQLTQIRLHKDLTFTIVNGIALFTFIITFYTQVNKKFDNKYYGALSRLIKIFLFIGFILMLL